MSVTLSGLRRMLPAVLLLVALATSVAACADIRPDNSPRSPVFHG